MFKTDFLEKFPKMEQIRTSFINGFNPKKYPKQPNNKELIKPNFQKTLNKRLHHSKMKINIV